jgi:2-polyprenyl-3-methyl-5-hydroxy-6-metoxy-1,4-benzoquinol methylase
VLALPDYLDRIGLGRFAPPVDSRVCELCGAGGAVSIRASVRVDADLNAAFVTRCCVRCGLLYQSQKFARGFYQAYYAQAYRRSLGAGGPSEAYVDDQHTRGESLHSALAPWLPRRGRLLDVGCGAGGMMLAFREQGWRVRGSEPDLVAASYAVERLGLDVVAASAERMALEAGMFDLVIITGSLEHVYDTSAVLRRCHAAAAPESLLLLEAHGLGQAAYCGAIGHNHRRLLTANTLALLMLRHGWSPVWITDQPLSGPSRPGSVFALGRRSIRPLRGAVAAAIGRGVRDTPAAMAELLDRSGIA